MTKDQAKKLVRNTLEKPFNREQFSNLVQNILNKMDRTKAFPKLQVGGHISEGFRDFVKSLDRIGQYRITNEKGFKEVIDILIVYLKKEGSLKRSRTTLRNYIAKYLKVDRHRQFKDGALVAFVSPGEEDWRFSFIKIDYKFNEQVKVKDDLTPARRYSFLVGENESSHTAQSCLLPLLEEDSKNPTLKDLEQAFSVEKVTKEFFEKYRYLFDKLKNSLDKIITEDTKIKKDFEKTKINSTNFSKKLLGQIVFLYFLQKKGWFGVKKGKEWGTGSKHFMRSLFNQRQDIYKSYGKESTKNFFNNILEPLFYEALRLEHSEDYYSRLDCRIPFLNGGLFEPINNYDWVNTDILLPDSLFSNQNHTKEGDTGDGILDIFDRYNFTVNEDEPLEKEVAVDPEMLGKVFENLLEKKDRKSKGTYYTPREIVHYMCQQSLINYLHSTIVIPAEAGIHAPTQDTPSSVSKSDIEALIKISGSSVEHDTVYQEKQKDKPKNSRYDKSKLPQFIIKNATLIDEALKNIRICDPAVGSGAFPVGMMNEIVRVRGALTPFIQESSPGKRGSTSHLNGYNNNRTPYHFKRHAIEHSLYGVDIDPGAIEIAKLRLWLSLVVDEEDRSKVQPLPNLDYKMVCGNSLLENVFYNTEKQEKSPAERYKIVSELKKKKDLFINTTSHRSKTNLLKEIKDLQKQLYEYDTNRAIGQLNQDIKNQKSQIRLFSDKTSEQDSKKITKDLQLKIQNMKNMKNRSYFEWHIDFSDIFQENGGFNITIANPPYVKEGVNKSAFDGLRKSPYYQGKMDLWYFFACKGIDISKPYSGVISFIAQNNWVTSFGASKMRNKVVRDSQILNLIDFGDLKVFDAGIQTMVMIFKKNQSIKEYNFDYRRLKGKPPTSKDMVLILNKETHKNTEYLLPRIERSNSLNKTLTFNDPEAESLLDKLASKADFQLTEREVGKAIEYNFDSVKPKHIEVLNKSHKVGDGVFVLKQKEKEKLSLTKKELQLIKPYYTTKELFRWSGNPENKEWIIYTNSHFKNTHLMNDYPNIKKHLDQFKKIITSDNKPYGLHRARKEHFFKGEKIITIRKCTVPTFSYVSFDSYVSATFYVIKTSRMDMKYLTGILNSKLVTFWLRHKGKMQGSNYQIDKEPLLAIPLINPSGMAQKPLIYLVDKILIVTKGKDYLKNSEKQNQVREYEKQIDHLVYKLYDLTSEEINVIEQETKK